MIPATCSAPRVVYWMLVSGTRTVIRSWSTIPIPWTTATSPSQ